MKPYTKFAVLIVIIVGVLLWLAVDGISESTTYYKTIAEVEEMGPEAYHKRLRVTGDIVPGSIRRNGTEVHFVIMDKDQRLNVVYTGSEPLPDTFRDSAQAMADGKLDPSGVFHASSIAAKCPSKYEAEPGKQQNDKRVYEQPSIS
ncbi:MAG: cytochrome c maturation protein CcmE [Bryobacteraceae bacterium]